MFRNLGLLLWKNLLIIRRKHWFLTLIEILLPILLFLLVAYGRSKISGLKKTEIIEPTYYEATTENSIYRHLGVGEYKLWYCPYTNFTEKIIHHLQEKFQFPGEDIKSFSTEEELLKYFAKNASDVIAINFKGSDTKKLNYDISIHDKYLTWNTDRLFNDAISEEQISDESSRYLYRGFTAIQVAINRAFMDLWQGTQNTKIDFNIQQFPYPPHIADSGINQLFIHFLPLITMFSFIFLCPAVLKRVGEEKYSGTKEFLKMVGVKSSTIWLGWFIHALSTNLISVIAIVIIMKVPFGDVSYAPIDYTNGVVLFVFLFLFCMAAISFCFLIATIFDRPSIATLIGVLIWIFSYFIPQTYISSKDNMKWRYKIVFAIFPNVALQYGYSAIAVYEMRDVGVQWSNLFQTGSGDENDVTMGNVFLCFIVDTVLFMIFTLYIENVKPGQYGIPKPFSFPLLNIKHWIKRRFTSTQIESVPNSLLDKVEKGIDKVPCIEIKNLFKKYYKHVAVENLTMDIYKNSITVLLGHNGAGKTTTMSIITGMIDATSGSVKVNGKDIKTQTDEVRRKMGLCPQHNLFFPDLTTSEHLQFFAMLRGRSMTDAKSDADEFLQKFGIPNEKKDSMAHTLSGGMKRKLCLGMALIGNPDVLVLDEPTSGLDPESRREVWNLLLEYKRSKTILITTHFMEEADVLGDWIAIMANGCLQCYDTPMRLKNLYNTGYHLSLMLESSTCLDKITNEITFLIPEAYLLRQNGDNAVYLLPLDKKQTYPELFKRLEEKKEQLGVVSIGLSITTLNDVYLKATDQADGKGEYEFKNRGLLENVDESDGTAYARNSMISRPIMSLVFKRWYFLKRKPYWYIPGIVISIGIFLLTLWLGMASTDYYNYGGTQLNMNLSIYGKTGVLYGGFDDSSNSYVPKMKEMYHDVVLKESGDPIQVEDTSQGIIDKGIKNIVYYRKHMIVAAEFNTSNRKDEVIVNAMYSGRALHSLPLSINLAMNAIVKTLLNESFSIQVSNKPLSSLYTDFSPSELSAIGVGILWLILVPTGMLFFMSNFIIFPNLEVATNFIQIQTMAGVKIYIYWLTNIIFDYFVLCLPKLIITYFIVKLVDKLAFDSAVLGDAEICALAVIFLSYSLASLPFVYLFSHKKTLSGGLTLLVMLGMFLGIVPTVVVRVLEVSGDDHYMEIGKYLKHVLLCTCPHFSLSYICVKFAQKYVDNFNWVYMNSDKKKYFCNINPNPCCYGESSLECRNYKSYFKNKDVGIEKELQEMMVSFIIYFVILCFLHSNLLKKISLRFEILVRLIKSKFEQNELKDSEDEEEIIKVEENQKTEDENEKRLRVQDLKKSFGTKLIVKGLQLTLKKNECFGLLGVNGAGKSTTFRMLIKDILYEKGKITMSPSKQPSIDISHTEYSKNIGYCPQEDYLNYFLTGREVLRTVALMRGYSRQESVVISNTLLKWFELEQYAEKPCLEYSGGNKRKLCACIAFLGCPQVILLDEPTSGVDPSSRRTFWNILSRYKKQKDTAILLCSHSMEECEALCDQIGIMKDGRISDEGSLLDLKNRHAKGYTVEINLKSVNAMSSNDVHSLLIQNSEILRNAELKNNFSDLLVYLVKNHDVTLSRLFTEMEQLKLMQKDYVEDYTLTQTSLEDIFLSVAKEK